MAVITLDTRKATVAAEYIIVHGGQDRVVPYHHFREFYDAIKATNRQLDKVVYQGEGHGWWLAKNRIDFWQRVERFLDKHIGPASLNAPAKENGRQIQQRHAVAACRC